MLATILPIKLATTIMSAWLAASTPVPLPGAAFALLLEQQAASPVELVIHDDNRGGVETKILLERDGTPFDAAMANTVAHVFRCRTDQEHAIAKRTLAMLAAVGERYGKPIDLVSGYRVRRGESWSSPHRAARAIDFRIKGVPLREIRDWVWRTYSSVGVGWYPSEQFLHIDSRDQDIAWTELRGGNDYKPYWAIKARESAPPPRRGPGV
jgi:uncharacterized protein YcbK (DUF882 family)